MLEIYRTYTIITNCILYGPVIETMKHYSVIVGTTIILLSLSVCGYQSDSEELTQRLDKTNTTLHSIKGRVTIEDEDELNWLSETFVVADGGKYHGYLKKNGEFTINRIPSGSHLVEVVSPKYTFDPVRVDITKSGRIRVREVNFTKSIKKLKISGYPLDFKVNKTAKFFEERETIYTWIINNPQNMLQMALYLTLTILVAVSVFVMPTMMESINQNQKDEDMQNLIWWSRLPSLEEILATLFMGGDVKELFTKVFEEEAKPNKNDALGSTRKRKHAAAKNKRRPKN